MICVGLDRRCEGDMAILKDVMRASRGGLWVRGGEDAVGRHDASKSRCDRPS
jgi:hypothetical protein